ncbi:GNAT family N-acetyltransferase [Streptacidiphilus griseoplanus]|uniref:GNAT family N-acetyltransferase n=1 Tax=Peterkaempfera griseoplana TaxID=66896 RepID=UPI0006E3CF45|nr:GNAT family N-acetyltransferase [Peterkaempfera griseoplana]
MDHLSKHHRWRREAVELSALFLAVATADLVADIVVHGHDGPVLLATSAAALLAAALFHGWWTHRHTHAPPGPDPSAGPAAEATRAETDTTAPGHPAAGFSLWRIRTTVADSPGSLAAVCAALARLEVNIISLQTHPLSTGTVDEFLVRAPSGVPRPALAGALAAAGGRDTWIDRADTHDLVDVPTTILGLATRTALDASELPVALRQLFGSCTIRSLPAATGPARPAGFPALDGDVMRLQDPSGGLIEVSRPHLPFTPTEFARARALVELDAVLGPRVPDHRDVVTLAAGNEITVRRAGPDDHRAALELHHRCSPETLRRRYHGPVDDADRYLGHLLEPRHGQTLTVELADGRLAALAHLMWDGDSAEVAMLVEDAWQRRGLGLELLRRLAALAAEAGVDTVYAVTQASNSAMVAVMRRLEVPLDYQVEDGTLVVTAHLARTTGQPAPRMADLQG